jgi:hypothetical protein
MALSPDSDLAADLAARGIDPTAAAHAAAQTAAAADRLAVAERDRYVEWCDEHDLDPDDPDTVDRWVAEAKPSERHFVRAALTWGKQNTAGEG